jgi:hypothetical protein
MRNMAKRGPQGSHSIERVETRKFRGLVRVVSCALSACGGGLTSGRRQWKSGRNYAASSSLDVVEEAMQHLILCPQMLVHRER